MFKHESGNLVEYRELPDLMHVDFHHEEGETLGSYWENMEAVATSALRALKQAHEEGK